MVAEQSVWKDKSPEVDVIDRQLISCRERMNTLEFERRQAIIHDLIKRSEKRVQHLEGPI